MISKFDGKGGVVRVEGTDRVEVMGQQIQVTSLQAVPEQKYKGEWLPGENHPTSQPDTSGPYAGIVRYRPIPESQIQR